MQSGVIVAGGRSTRFGGRDKAVADLAGTPMIRRVADRLVDAVDELVVNCRPEQTGAIRTAMDGYPLPVRFAEDDEPGRGPVAGIRNGLCAASGAYGFVVACDMPFVEPALVAYLFEQAAGHDAAVPRLDDGRLQPTHAVYHAAAAVEACDSVLAGDDPRAVDPLTSLAYVEVDAETVARVADSRSLTNVNTHEEFAAAASRLE